MTAAAAGARLSLARQPVPPLWLMALLILLVHGGYTLATGTLIAPDTASYDYWAGRLVESGFDYAGLAPQTSSEFPAILYLLFVTLVAVLQLLFGAGWPYALVALNLAADVALGVMIVRLAARVTGGAVAAWTALLLFTASFEILHWIPFALSDTTFVLIAFSVFSLVAARILGDAKGWASTIAIATAGVFYRPTGMVLLPDLAWAAYLARAKTVAIRRGRFLVGLAALAVAGAFAFAWFMQDPGRWPFQTLAKAFEVTARGYASGYVIDARPEIAHQAPEQLVDFVLISADRFIHFFAIGAPGFSLAHWAAQLLFFVPCYALAAWLLVALWRGQTEFPDAERRVFLASAGAILAYAAFHGLIQVDFDWRYRLPILPHLIILAAGGAADLARRAGAR
jgi:hypothetical protein